MLCQKTDPLDESDEVVGNGENGDVIDGVKTYDGVEHKTGQRENVAVMDHRWGK